MSDLIFVLDKDGIFIDYNNPSDTPEIYAPPEVFLKKHYNQILPPEIVAKIDKAIQKARETSLAQQFDY